MLFHFLDSICNWYHTVFVFLRHISQSIILFRSICVASNSSIFSLCLSNSPSCVYVPHLLIQSSVDGHLGCFYIWGILNSAVINFGVHGPLWISIFIFFPDIYSRVELLDHMVALEKAMATHSSTLAWKIPWTEEPGRLHGVHGVARSRTWLSDLTFTFHFHALEKEMATHSSVPAWRIPGTGEPSMGSHRVGHDWSSRWLLPQGAKKQLNLG